MFRLRGNDDYVASCGRLLLSLEEGRIRLEQIEESNASHPLRNPLTCRSSLMQMLVL